MEELMHPCVPPQPAGIGSTIGSRNPARHGLFLRSSSQLAGSSEDSSEMQSEGSDCGMCAPSLKRISLAKQVLADSQRYAPVLPRSSGLGRGVPRNTGALGSLLARIQVETEPDCLRACLDTLAFLLMDRANRRAVQDCNCLDTVMRVVQSSSPSDTALQCSALDAVCSLVKSDDQQKELLWQHPGKARLLSLLAAKLPHSQLAEVLCMLRKVAFTTSTATAAVTPDAAPTALTFPAHTRVRPRPPAPTPLTPSPPSPAATCIDAAAYSPATDSNAIPARPSPPPQLLEPGLLAAVAGVISPMMSHAAMLRALRLLKMCAEGGQHLHLAAWHTVVFKLVPLLREPGSCEATLDVLLTLSEQPSGAFRNIFMAAGAVSPLLTLMLHPNASIATTAACVVSCLSDSGLSQEQLCREASLLTLLRTLAASTYTDVLVGAVYTMNRLAAARPGVAPFLAAKGTVQLVSGLLGASNAWCDPDLQLGCCQLVERLRPGGTGQGAASHPASRLQSSTLLPALNSVPGAAAGAGGTAAAGVAVAPAQAVEHCAGRQEECGHGGCGACCEGSRQHSPQRSRLSLHLHSPRACKTHAVPCDLSSCCSLPPTPTLPYPTCVASGHGVRAGSRHSTEALVVAASCSTTCGSGSCCQGLHSPGCLQHVCSTALPGHLHQRLVEQQPGNFLLHKEEEQAGRGVGGCQGDGQQPGWWCSSGCTSSDNGTPPELHQQDDDGAARAGPGAGAGAFPLHLTQDSHGRVSLHVHVQACLPASLSGHACGHASTASPCSHPLHPSAGDYPHQSTCNVSSHNSGVSSECCHAAGRVVKLPPSRLCLSSALSMPDSLGFEGAAGGHTHAAPHPPTWSHCALRLPKGCAPCGLVSLCPPSRSHSQQLECPSQSGRSAPPPVSPTALSSSSSSSSKELVSQPASCSGNDSGQGYSRASSSGMCPVPEGCPLAVPLMPFPGPACPACALTQSQPRACLGQAAPPHMLVLMPSTPPNSSQLPNYRDK
ncbi:hypothetical protein V8C86DRAFT_2523864 [Haematococcus lacustris]